MPALFVALLASVNSVNYFCLLAARNQFLKHLPVVMRSRCRSLPPMPGHWLFKARSDSAYGTAPNRTVRYIARIRTILHLRWPQLLCPWTNCVEQSAIRFAVYGHLAEHFQEQTENISVWRWRALAHLLHLQIWAIYVSLLLLLLLEHT